MKGRLTGKVGVIKLNIPAASVIQDLKLILIRPGDIAKVLVIGSIHVLWVGLALLIPQVIPVRSSKGEFDVLDLLGGDDARQVLEFLDIGTTDVLDFASTDDSLARLVSSFKESSDIGSIGTEYIGIDVCDFLKTIKSREERTPEHYMEVKWLASCPTTQKIRPSLTVSAVFSIRDGGVAKLLLSFNDLLDILVLDSVKISLRDLLLFESCLCLQQFIGTKERAKVLGTERRVVVKLMGHIEDS